MHRNLLFIVYCLIAFSTVSAMAQQFTEADNTILTTSTDPDEVIEVIYKLADLYDTAGKAALQPAVPGLIAAAERELGLSEDERWNIYEIIKVASLTGDARVKPLLLRSMSMMGGGGNPFTAQGFLGIGSATVSDLTDSLKSADPNTRGRAAITLHKMVDLDESGGFFTAAAKSQVRDLLVANLGDENASVRLYAVIALRNFGDATVMDPLRDIEKNDAHKDSGGTYEVRVEAAETLKLLEQ